MLVGCNTRVNASVGPLHHRIHDQRASIHNVDRVSPPAKLRFRVGPRGAHRSRGNSALLHRNVRTRQGCVLRRIYKTDRNGGAFLVSPDHPSKQAVINYIPRRSTSCCELQGLLSYLMRRMNSWSYHEYGPACRPARQTC